MMYFAWKEVGPRCVIHDGYCLLEWRPRIEQVELFPDSGLVVAGGVTLDEGDDGETAFPAFVPNQ